MLQCHLPVVILTCARAHGQFSAADSLPGNEDEGQMLEHCNKILHVGLQVMLLSCVAENQKYKKLGLAAEL